MNVKENDNQKNTMIDLKENEQSENEFIKKLKNDPGLMELAKAVCEEFDENGNYIGE